VRSKPDGLDVRAVVDALRDGWDFGVDVAEYAAVGGGSYHWEVTDETGVRGFVTVDDLDQKAWLGATRDTALDGLRCAFDTAVALRDSGLHFVVAPIPTRAGESLRRLDSRYAIALFPFVDGEAGEFGYYEDDEEGRKAVVGILAELHEATAAAGPAVRTVGLDLPGHHHLDAALRELDEAWTGGPLSEPARAAVRDSASELTELLTLADRLAADDRRAEPAGSSPTESRMPQTSCEPGTAGSWWTGTPWRSLRPSETCGCPSSAGQTRQTSTSVRPERGSTTLRSTSSASPGISKTSPSTSTCFARPTRKTTTP
jgi:hypothetical protein